MLGPPKISSIIFSSSSFPSVQIKCTLFVVIPFFKDNIELEISGFVFFGIPILAIAILSLFRVRGPVLAIPFAGLILFCIVSPVTSALYYFFIHGVPNAFDIKFVIELISAAVFSIPYILLGIAAIGSKKKTKPLLSTIASVLLLISAFAQSVVDIVSIFLRYHITYGWSFEYAIRNLTVYLSAFIITHLPSILLGIILAAGMFFLGLWMAKGKPQEQTSCDNECEVENDAATEETVEKIAGKETTVKNAITTDDVSFDDSVQRIKKYKDLLDMGAITEEEYNEKKKQLLNM